MVALEPLACSMFPWAAVVYGEHVRCGCRAVKRNQVKVSRTERETEMGLHMGWESVEGYET